MEGSNTLTIICSILIILLVVLLLYNRKTIYERFHTKKD